MRYQNSTFVNITTNFYFIVADTSFPKSNFHLKAKILSLATDTTSCFPLKTPSYIFFSLNNHSLSVVVSSYNGSS